MKPPPSTLTGTVFKLLGKEASVRFGTEEGDQVLLCYLRGRLFSSQSPELERQIAVGDQVEVDPIDPMRGEGPHRGVVHRVLPRRTALVRRSGGRKPRTQVLAANLDQIVIVSALLEPPYRTGLIDRYLVIAHHAGIAPVLCLNKIDLGDEAALEKAREDLSVYASLGYPLVLTSAVSLAGVPELRALLAGKRSVLAGHSGVGKTKLASALQPGLRLASAEVDRRGRGRHTTSASTLFPLASGGELVDTPGVRELSLHQVEREELDRWFIEFRPHLDQCRFASCTHIPEPECGVKQAVGAGRIGKARYESYRKLYEELSGAAKRSS